MIVPYPKIAKNQLPRHPRKLITRFFKNQEDTTVLFLKWAKYALAGRETTFTSWTSGPTAGAGSGQLTACSSLSPSAPNGLCVLWAAPEGTAAGYNSSCPISSEPEISHFYMVQLPSQLTGSAVGRARPYGYMTVAGRKWVLFIFFTSATSEAGRRRNFIIHDTSRSPPSSTFSSLFKSRHSLGLASLVATWTNFSGYQFHQLLPS